ncbi:DUF1972 domain-containing protein [Litorivicinus lipolyticus]|uniref:DUF1972 domain-containing protein n=1 Tax=Litorivicinus lipolyticus TaxID=418701 RepID=A0A5Q2QFL4_9GAMM|nr:DUF1972 domain-containing protein [Litorivicinus lipolyticus]QGG80630.1 DUF1972 domain-containing protein [Litorivicinus lipolyticus]
MKKRVAIVGANGVPASYGGWDQLVEHFTRLKDPNFEFVVYCTYLTNDSDNSSHNNAHVRVIRLDANGWQSIPYDIVSLYHAWRECDAAIMLGTSGALALPIFRLAGLPVILNIDGAEWKRGKWNRIIKVFLWLSEFVGILSAKVIVSDNEVLSEYVRSKYNKEPITIAYGGNHVKRQPVGTKLAELGLNTKTYAIKVCRIVPENNVDLILSAFAETSIPFVLVGNFNSSDFGRELRSTYSSYTNLKLLDPIYEPALIDELRSNAGLYVHGHSVGGTNPSLVEAMCLGLNILAFDVDYNRATTADHAHYFATKTELLGLLKEHENGTLKDNSVNLNSIGLRKYSWSAIMARYTDALKSTLKL